MWALVLMASHIYDVSVRTQPSGQFDRSRDVARPTFAQTADAQQFNPNDYRGQGTLVLKFLLVSLY